MKQNIPHKCIRCNSSLWLEHTKDKYEANYVYINGNGYICIDCFQEKVIRW